MYTTQKPYNAWVESNPGRNHTNLRSKHNLVQLLLEYAQNTSLHGLRYTTEKGRTWFERIFWLLNVLISLGFCLYLTHNVWHKWNSRPVIVGFNEKSIPVEMIPFPSLTICPQVKVRASVYNYTEKMQYILQDIFSNEHLNQSSGKKFSNLTNKVGLKEFLDASLICPVPFYVDMKYIVMLPGSLTTDHTTIENIKKISPTKDFLQKCTWLGVELNCSEIFDTVLTEEGVCFNFNGVESDEIFRTENLQQDYKYNEASRKLNGWNRLTGYIDNDFNGTRYPFAGKYNTRSPLFEILLATPRTDYDLFCNVINKGYKVFIQHPCSQPQSSVYSYSLLPGRVSALALKVNVMNTSKSLTSCKPEVRQCYFDRERYLRYFKMYTSTNCMLECMSNITFKMCKCVSFYMPHNDSKSICTVQNEDCLRNTRVSKELFSYLEKECSCLPHCNYLLYEPEVLKSKFDFKTSVRNLYNIMGQTMPDHIKHYRYSKLEVFFKDANYVSMIRSELFGVTELFANIGGLLGLFMGFSLLSFVEIFYFFTIRYFLSLRKDTNPLRKDQTKTKSTNIFDVEKAYIK